MSIKSDVDTSPLVSIIVPNYNHSAFLEQRLDSVFNQTYKNFEVILLDDCSTDQSREILGAYRNHPKVKDCIYNFENSASPFRQWEKGINIAEGKYIWIAESDDWADKTFLDVLIPRFSDSIGLVYCKSYTCFEEENRISTYYFPDELQPGKWEDDYVAAGKSELSGYHIFRNTIPNVSACVFEKKLASFDSDIRSMKYCGDWLFWAKLFLKTDICFVSERLNYWRHSSQSVWGGKSNSNQEKEIFDECIFSINKMAEMIKTDQPRIANYNWLFNRYYSSIPVWKVPIMPTPDLPVKKFYFRFYLVKKMLVFILLKLMKNGGAITDFLRSRLSDKSM